MRKMIAALALVTVPVFAAAQGIKPCEQLKAEIAAKLDAKGVKSYTLEIVANDAVGERKVVGSCDGGTRKIVYTRGS
jgi:hypothetical protein